jgi:ERCC4-type nuclease
MILVDDRRGSIDLLPLFAKGTPIERTRMDFGDFAFTGCGAEGPVFVGLERKAMGDLLNSIMTGRLSGHQLIGLLDAYQYVYIVVEGWWRSNPTSGLLETYGGRGWHPISVGSRRFMARELIGYLNTLTVRAGIIVTYTWNKHGTAELVSALYRWWQKPWEEHSSHLAQYKAGPPDHAALVRPSLVRRVAAELPGVGWGKSEAVAGAFSTVEDMVRADVAEWENIPGIGPKLARGAVASLKGEKT